MTITAARNMAAEVGLDARNHTPFKAESCRPNCTRSGASAGTGLGDGGCGLDICQWILWGTRWHQGTLFKMVASWFCLSDFYSETEVVLGIRIYMLM